MGTKTENWKKAIKKMEKEIMAYWGSQCHEFHKNCGTCKTWRAWDQLKKITSRGIKNGQCKI